MTRSKRRPRLGITLLLPLVAALAAFTAKPAQATPPAGYTLGWSDEFNGAVGSAPNSAFWSYDTGNSGFGNGELETYVTDTAHSSIISDSAATDGKALRITATDNNGGIGTAGIYNSARIYTGAKVGIQYGYIEMRAKAPQGGKGIWPAFWMLGGDSQTLGWPGCGEQDILEMFGDPTVNATSWHMSYLGSEADWTGTYKQPGGGTFGGTYHTYSILWSQTQLVAYVDGVQFENHSNASSPGWIFNHPFYFLLNLAVGGGPPGTPDASTVFPQTYDIDYIRVYNGPQDYSPGSGTITDQCDSFAVPYNTSGNWVIDRSNPTFFGNDDGRISRVVNTTQFVNWKYTNIKSMSAKIGTNTTDTAAATIWYSTNNGSTYTQAATSVTAITPTASGWGLYTLSTTGTLPAGVTDIKLQETPTVNAWDHQICQVTIVSDARNVPPLTPTNTATVAGNAQNTISWVASSGAVTYNLYRTTVPYTEAAPASVSNISGTSYTDTGLANGTTYYYAVAAVNGSGTSAFSVQTQGTPTGTGGTCTATPGAPGGLAASGTTSTGTNLNWNSVGAPANCSITGYAVYKNGTSIGTSGSTTFAVTGLSPSTAYTFTVAAIDSAGTGPQSAGVNVTTPAGSGSEGPYLGTAWAIPGTVQAENFDTGGEGVAYHDADAANNGGQYRTTDGVDIEATTDTGTGYNIGWTAASEYMKYTVNVATAGTYTVGFRVAAPAAVTGALNLSNAAGTNLSGNVNVPATGGYQTWQTVNATVTLPAGQQILRVNELAAGWNLNNLVFTAVSTPKMINSGGAASGSWVADVNFTGGTATTTTTAVNTSLLTGTIPPQAVLLSNRFGTSTYTVPGFTAGSSHTVTLYFSEGYWTAAGKRTFNVVINSTTVLTNFDIFATAGAQNKAVQRSFTATANASGQIVINFNTVIDNAQINGISIS